jgi:hypothetical protein
MKKISPLLLIIFFFTAKASYSQSDFLNINNIRANIDPNTLFNNISNGSSSFEIPVGNGTHTIYSASLWLAGIDENGEIRTNVNTYHNASQKIAGPIMNSSDYASEGHLWDKVWKIQCQEIQQFNAWYACTQDLGCDEAVNFPGYQIPASILTWPAHGDVTKGQAFNLAPYFDRNNDNFYDPNSGDYPLIKGDEAIFFIYNDERSYYTGGDTHPPMSTEVHGMAYAFSTSDIEINNTLFLNYKIYPRGTFTFNNSYVGFWADFDLGNSSDDYLGTDVSRSSFYAYNGDYFDENNGGIGYGSNLPAQSLTFLKGPKQDNNGLDDSFGIENNESINGLGFGDGIVDNEYWGLESFLRHDWNSSTLGSPVTETHFYNYLSGKKLDGSSLTYTSGGIDCKFMYPGSSDPFNYGTGGTAQLPWSEYVTGSNAGDRVGVGSSGPFTISPGNVIELDLALVFGRDLTGSGPQAGIAAMQEAIDTVRSQYLRGITSDCASNMITKVNSSSLKEKGLLIYPNPFNTEFTINYELESKTASIVVYNGLGKKIQSKTITRNSTVIDLSHHPKGFYFVHITDGENRISKKIIKQ